MKSSVFSKYCFSHLSRSVLLIGCLMLLGILLIEDVKSAEKSRRRRFIYNSDGNHMYYYKKPPMSVRSLQSCVDEVVGTGVTTFFASPNWGMPMAYPSKVTEMVGSTLTNEDWVRYHKIAKEKKKSTERAYVNLYGILNSGHDPFGVMINRAREKGLEVFVSYRPNEIHDVQNPKSLIVSKFWRDHPEWRVGKIGDEITPVFAEIIGGRKDYPVHPIVKSWFPGALNFAIPEVRAQRMAEMRECCERYNIDGLDIDFQRFPIFFPQEEGPQHVKTMTTWMREVRAMTQKIGKNRGRPLLLSVRIMAKPEQNLSIGIDPINWAKEGLVDFIVVSHYLRNDFALPIKQYRSLMPKDMPIYASIEVEKTADKYRKIARQLYDDGVDGLMMFNYFTCREAGMEPDFSLLKELSDPAKIKPIEPEK